MSAGDIIDRAVRLYKRNFLALVRIVLAPSLVSFAGSILFSIGLRNFSLIRGDARVAMTIGMIIGGGLLWLVGEAAFYAVLGGSSRALLAHFFDGKPILARDVYASVRERIWALVGATLMIGLMVFAMSWLVFLVIFIFAVIISAIANKLISGAPEWIQMVYGIISFIGTVGLIILSFLLVYSRVVYVPQILMVERKGVFSAISRSFQLASGELIRIGAVIIFWIYVAWSLWVLMAVPVSWYAYVAGVDITPFNAEVPLWYQIAKQTLTQVSEILIWPIAMLCFTLLYINSRVRKEGYDVELQANRVLPPPPPIPHPQPIFQQQTETYASTSALPSILGLNDYNPVQPATTFESGNHDSAVKIAAPVESGDNLTDRNIASSATATVLQESPEISISGFRPVDHQTLTETAVEKADVSQTTAPAFSKVCSWCGTGAGVEDRFCRVCGSVF